MNDIFQEIPGESPRDPGELRPPVLPSEHYEPAETGALAEAPEVRPAAEAWEGEETTADEAPAPALRDSNSEFDPYAGIRPALSPEHAALAADEITAVLGPQPAILALYGLLSQPDLPQTALAVLLGKMGRRTLRVNSADIPVAVYLRQLSRLCREVADYHEAELGPEEGAPPPSLEQESFEGLKRKLKFLSFFSHSVAAGGNETALQPTIMDPGIYDGKDKFKFASSLQSCLETAMKGHGQVRAALVDLTKKVSAPEFAGLGHQEQVFAASVPKLAAMLAAFQLRHDLRIALSLKGSKSLEDLFSKVRDYWTASQQEPKGSAVPFTKDITVRGRLVLLRGRKVDLDTDDRSPRLESIFAALAAGAPVHIEFSSTGENYDQLDKLVDDFESKNPKTKANARKSLEGLGFLERLRVSMGGVVPASNFITSTLVREIGYPYIASTLLQSGLYDPARGGGMWLGHSYWGSSWRGALSGGPPQSATAGGAAAFMALLAQNRLVDPHSSAEMRALIQKHPFPTHPTIKSSFEEGIRQLPHQGSRVLVLSKLGVLGGIDDCAYIERKVDEGRTTLCYVAVGLRGKTDEELRTLILKFDKCILANNGLTAAQGGHPDEHEVLDEELDWPPPREALAPETGYESEFPAEAPLTDEETGIIGADDRLHVNDTTAIPFRWICSVSVQRLVKRPSHNEKTGLAPAGSGVLISPRHVLTAAHVLHSVDRSSDGSIAAEYEPLLVHVAPARDGNSKPFGEFEAKSWAIHPKWDPKAPLARYDYAVITLDTEVGNQKFKSLGNKPLGFWGSAQDGGSTLIDSLPAPLSRSLIGTRVVTAGYPQSRKQEMWCAAGVFSTGSAQVDAQLTRAGQVAQWVAANSVFKITADATEGQSGSPVWVVDNGKRYLIGIIEAAGQTYNDVVAVKGDVVSQIRTWK
jgi:V8-like Glu-specific endopeptidase